MLNRVLIGARNDEDEKVGFSMQLPKSLKDKFDAYCKKNKVTMTGMLQSFMQYTVNVDSGVEEDKSEMPSAYKSHILVCIDDSINRLERIFEKGDYESAEHHSSLHNQHDALIATRNYLLGGKK